MEIAVEKLVALCCIVIGLSHLIQPGAWAQLFIEWRGKREVGAFYTGLLHFQFGALIVAFHNVWEGIPMVVTLLGWAWTLKGALYLLFPKWPLRMLDRISLERAWEFTVAGIFLMGIGLLISYSLVSRAAF